MVVPQPADIQHGSGHWVLPRQVAIVCSDAETATAQLLQDALMQRFDIQSVRADKAPQGGAISLAMCADMPQLQRFRWREEGYQLVTIAGSGASITASTQCGLFYGTQTLLQLIQSSDDTGGGDAPTWRVPAIQVRVACN